MLLDSLKKGSKLEMSSKLTLCVLQSNIEFTEYADDDEPADVESHLRRAGYTEDQVRVEAVVLKNGNHQRQLVKLAQRYRDGEIDCFINLCDGAWDEPSCGIEIVDMLQNKLLVPFTGANLDFFEPTRLQMKKAALGCGVKVPVWRFIYSDEDFEAFAAELADGRSDMRFPMLTKHFSSYSSVGLTKESKVTNMEQLRKECGRFLQRYGGCLIEEFIEGREFTVLVSEVPDENDGVQIRAYDPVECKFGPGEEFKHYNLKWVDFDEMAWVPVLDQDIKKRLRKMAVDVFSAIRGRGYGRLDVRADASGENLYFLEINPNCGIFYPEKLYGSADFILAGMDPVKAHGQFILDQVEVARRHLRKRMDEKTIIESRFDSVNDSWGIFALRDLQPGDTILKLEESAMYLVSKQHILRTWENVPANLALNDSSADAGRNSSGEKPTTMRTWANFTRYCWPLSDNLFAMWDPHPDNWKPINHNCDPNSWQADGSGLNLVARRAISRGEEVTMDYATFVGYFPEMQSFKCSCGAASCRSVITGMDIVKHPHLAEIYKGHLSDYVASKVSAKSQ